MSTYVVNVYELISLIGLCLRVWGCEVMTRAQSYGEMVLMAISEFNGYKLINLIGLCLRREDVRSWAKPNNRVKTNLIPISENDEEIFYLPVIK